MDQSLVQLSLEKKIEKSHQIIGEAYERFPVDRMALAWTGGIDIQLNFPDGTLSTEHQNLIEVLNRFLALHPNNEDGEAAVRLAMEFLELADVAPQPVIARAVGYAQPLSLRTYKQRLQAQGLSGLFDQPITGRPAVERAVVEAVLEAIITEHTLPDGETLAQVVNRHLAAAQAPKAGQVTASVVETIRLRLGIRRPIVAQQLQASDSSTEEQARLGRTRAGGAFILAVLLVETRWLKAAELLQMAPGYVVTAVQ